MSYIIKHKTKGFYMGGTKFSPEYPDSIFFNSDRKARLVRKMLIDRGEKEENLEIFPSYGLKDANYV